MCDVRARNGEVKHHQQVIQQTVDLLHFCESGLFRRWGTTRPYSAQRVLEHIPRVHGVHGFLVVEPLKVTMQFDQNLAKVFLVAIRREQENKESFEDWFEMGSNDLWRGIPQIAQHHRRRLMT